MRQRIIPFAVLCNELGKVHQIWPKFFLKFTIGKIFLLSKHMCDIIDKDVRMLVAVGYEVEKVCAMD